MVIMVLENKNLRFIGYQNMILSNEDTIPDQDQRQISTLIDFLVP